MNAEVIHFREGQSLAGPGAYDAGSDVTYTPYYRDEKCEVLGGLFLWHPCTAFPRDTHEGVGPNTKTGSAWGYSNAEDPAHITLDGSILDPDCGFHGWIRDGRWVSAG